MVDEGVVGLWVTSLLPLVIMVTLWLVAMVVGVLALLDLAQRPEGQLAAAGQSHTTWLVVAVVALVVPCAFPGAAYYLLAVRPKLPPRRLA